MKSYIVKKLGQVARAFLAEFHIGLVPNPEEHARAEAMEYLHEGVQRDKLQKKYKETPFTNCVLLEEIEDAT